MSPRVGYRLRFARIQGQIEFTLERQTGKGSEHHYHSCVHDVPAVAPPIARDQPWQGYQPRFVVHAVPRIDALVELLDDRRQHQRAE